MATILCVPVFDVKVQPITVVICLDFVSQLAHKAARSRPLVYPCCNAFLEEHAIKGSCIAHLRRTDQLLGTPSAVRPET